ncbi:hypothetical protein NECAME_09672 [Necator americanus]|uniref:Uncharacterized protein n=1 Tax=Necator americanus TaxID=51031 RepID=W2TCU2_NECAM|nr:hypothetical protein NECAME_09672 [Necator americanus]ETN79663.1 hypothetical protein NECAME_09672 [Necator americanus]
MSGANSTELAGTGELPDINAEEEERYRLKTIALQERYDTVALQSVRLRERIYQVKKQCRRLEVMKRVTLNMLHQNTGTYDIPPLEIVDEPSRSKADGKLTAEEEERAKQKICSIIDSVYSETARRMGDSSRRPLRNSTVSTPLNSGDVSDGICSSLILGTDNKLSGEAAHATVHKQPGTGNSNCHPSSEFGSHQLDKGLEVGKDEENSRTIFYVLGSNSKMKNSHGLNYEPILNQEQAMVCEGVEESNRTACNISEIVLGTGITYDINAEQVATSLAYPTYDTSVVPIQPLNYNIETVVHDQDVSEQSTNYELLHEENSVKCDNSVKYSISTPSSGPPSYGENVNPRKAMDYGRNGNSSQFVRYVLKTSKESGNLSSQFSTPLTYDGTNSPAGSVNGDRITSTGAAVRARETAQQSASGSTTLARGDHHKQDTSRSVNCSLPLPDFIPYRMIAVENPKPVEVITIDSGDETSPPKQVPRRRRKYKYVVESVLDNVPYTFRQAESDDDETTDKNSTIVNSTILASN